MPPGFERANIRFFYLFKNNIAGLFSVKQSGNKDQFILFNEASVLQQIYRVGFCTAKLLVKCHRIVGIAFR